MSEYTCHSGGAIGSDLCWEVEGEKWGVNTIAYSFYYHKTESKNIHILMGFDLAKGWEHIQKANETLKRDLRRIEEVPYTKNLLCRNWFQVCRSETIFAIAELTDNRKQVKGGTGWAVQMAIDNDKEVYIFDQTQDQWYIYNTRYGKFIEYYGPVKLTKNFAGIGTRNLNKNGVEAIKQVYKNTFNDFSKDNQANEG